MEAAAGLPHASAGRGDAQGATKTAAAETATPTPTQWSIPALWTTSSSYEELSACEVLEATPEHRITAQTLPSTRWTPELLSALSSGLIRDRNRFVCMQLATMAAEQMQKVERARAQDDPAGMRHAASVFLSTLEADGELVGAALHYPRAASKPKAQAGSCGSQEGAAAAVVGLIGGVDKAAAAVAAATHVGGPCSAVFPHVYVELICINQPGKGYGSTLLQHVEAFALSNAAALLRAALLTGPSPALAPAPSPACPPECTSCLRGIKLLSVESAQRFYSANGFSEPDGCSEMFKPLAGVRRGLLRAA